MKIYFIVLISINLLSCHQVHDETKSKNEVKELTKTIDSTFKFKDKVYSMFEDSKGNYWIGTKENGVCKFDGETYAYFTTKDGLANNSIPSIQEDINGSIWFDGEGQITKYDGEEFTVFKKKSISKIDNIEYPIKLSKSDLWFRHENDFGIYRYDGKKLSFIEFQKPEPNKINGRLGFGVTGVTNLANGKVWFGTSYAGAFGFDGENFEVINNQSLGLDVKNDFLHIRSILADSKENIWIGNNGIGVLLKNEKGIANFSKDQGKLISNEIFVAQNYISDGLQAVFAIEEDNEGNIWFGESNTGAWKYDGKVLTNYKIDTTLKNEDMIWDIYNDRNGNLWFILANETVYTFNGKSFDRFNGFNTNK